MYAGQVLLLSRRATRRHFLFTPDEAGLVEQLFWYSLAWAARKYGIVVHAACLMSTHWHLVVTDTRGEYSRFLQRLDRMMALGIKALRGWPGEVFDKCQTSALELTCSEAVIKELGYTIANPTSSFAVRYSKDWPGVRTSVEDLGNRTVTASRPDFYFDPKNADWDESIELEIEMPECLLDEYRLELARARVTDRVRENEREAWQEAQKHGIGFMGPRRALRQPHTRRARSYETFGSRNPRFSAAGNVEVAVAVVKRNRKFDADYDEALARWQAGDRDVLFPFGTWWMRVHHGVRCHPPPS